jgi:integrase
MSSRPVPRRLTVETALSEYIASRSPRLKAKTVQEYGIRADKHLTPFLGKKLLEALRSSDVEAYQKARVDEGAEPGTVNGETALLRAMVRKAIAWGWIDRDPLPPGAFSTLPGERGRVDYFTPAEWRSLRDALDDDVRPAFRALLYSGSRLNEVLSLTWGDVDLSGRKITFTMRKVGGRLKSQRMSGALAEVLEALPRGTPAAHVFTRADGSPWPDHEVKRRYYRAARKAGTRETLTIHSVRHTFASWLAIDGVPLRTIAELLGHQNVTMTFRYAHLSPAHLQEAVERIEAVEKSTEAPFGRHRDDAPGALIHSRD